MKTRLAQPEMVSCKVDARGFWDWNVVAAGELQAKDTLDLGADHRRRGEVLSRAVDQQRRDVKD